MIMKDNLSLTWNLENIFRGGSQSEELTEFIKQANALIDKLSEELHPFSDKQEKDQLVELTETIKQAQVHTREIGAFISCLTAQDVTDNNAKLLVSQRNQLSARLQKLMTKFGFALSRVDDETWLSWLEDDKLKPIAFVLNEMRDETKEKLPEEQEQLITDLAIDGYNAWGEMYDTIVGKMTVDWEGEILSVGQLDNKLNSSSRQERKLAFEKLTAVWNEQSHLFTDTLNHLAGFRLQKYAHRNWDDVLQEPLAYNRMTKQT